MGHTLNPSTMEAGGIREFKVILSHLASSRPAWDPETLSQRQQKRVQEHTTELAVHGLHIICSG